MCESTKLALKLTDCGTRSASLMNLVISLIVKLLVVWLWPSGNGVAPLYDFKPPDLRHANTAIFEGHNLP